MFVPLTLLLLVSFSSGEITAREAKDEEFPFQVSIKDLNNNHLCGGAIIAPKWILTSSDCLNTAQSVIIGYGSASSTKQKRVNSLRIYFHPNKGRFALIELVNEIEFSNTAKQAKLPTINAVLKNSTKLSGWKVEGVINEPVSLHVIDKYNLVFENCKTLSGGPVRLDKDEFCGFEENHENILYLSNTGTTVSKSAIILGMLTKHVGLPTHPGVFTKVAENGEWIKDVLNRDAGYISWVDEIPKDSATFQCSINMALLGISVIFLIFFNKN